MKDYNELSEEEQIKTVKEWPSRIIFITNPSEKVKLEAIKKVLI